LLANDDIVPATDVTVSVSSTGDVTTSRSNVHDISDSESETVEYIGDSTLSAAQIYITMGGTIEMQAGGGFRALVVQPTINITGDPAGVSFLTFSFAPTVNLAAAAADINNPRIFTHQPTFNMLAATAHGDIGASSGYRPFVDLAIFAASATGATATVDLYRSFESQISVGTGWTFNTLRLFHARKPLLTGVITTLVAYDVENLGGRAGTNIAFRQLGTSDQNRFVGQTIFGADAAPTNAQIAAEVQSTTRAFAHARMTTAQRDTMTAAGVVDGMVIYNTTTAQKETRQAGAWVAT
jgi:hypothetical protein